MSYIIVFLIPDNGKVIKNVKVCYKVLHDAREMKLNQLVCQEKYETEILN